MKGRDKKKEDPAELFQPHLICCSDSGRGNADTLHAWYHNAECDSSYVRQLCEISHVECCTESNSMPPNNIT